jgi:ribonuclease R
MSKKNKSSLKARKQVKQELEKAIISFFEKNPKRLYNYKQAAAQLGISDTFTRKIVEEIIDKLERNEFIKEVEIGKYKYNGVKINEGGVTGTLSVAGTGVGFVTVEGMDEDIFIHSSKLGNALNGDVVTVKLQSNPKRGKRAEGIITSVVFRKKTRFVGVIQKSRDFAFLISDDAKIHVDFFIPLNALNEANDGEKVIAELVEWDKQDKNPTAKVVQVLGDPKDKNVEILSILANAGFDSTFDKEITKAAESISKEITTEEISKRRDFRNITTFTIDPLDAKDFDDALSVETLPNGNYSIGVHIADVTHYLVPGSIIDHEAIRRATSVYLVDRVIPMLPEVLSNELCSLRPKEEKLCFSVVFELTKEAEIMNTWFGKTIIYSDQRFTYEQVQEIIEKQEGDFKDELLLLNDLAKKIRTKRIKSGSILFNKIEVKFHLDEKRMPVGVYFKEQKDAHKLIEEFMLLANKSVALFVNNRKEEPKTYVYRVHDKPDMDKLNNFNQFITKFGYKLNMNDISSSLNKLLIDVKGKGEENLLETLAIRSMAKAYYSTKNIGHYGLSFTHYSHFTSPIRRYPDVIAHRLLYQYLQNENLKNIKEDEIEALCKHSSEMERSAAEAERDSTKFFQVIYMSDKIGKTFEGIVSGVTEWGMFIEIVENKCEGLIRLQNIPGDYFMFDEKNYRVVGRKTGRAFWLGDKVMVRIKEANLEKKQLDFELLSGQRD